MIKLFVNRLARLKLWFYANFVYISLKQLNLMAIWAVLVFTIVFSALLIQEESKVFDTKLANEEALYEQNQKNTLLNIVYQVKALAEDEILYVPNVEERLEHLVCLFSLTDKQYVLIKTKERFIFCSQGPFDKETVNTINLSSEKQFVSQLGAITYVAPIAEGYTLIAGVYGGLSHRLLEKREAEMKSRLIRIILGIVTLAFILFAFILAINKIVNTLLAKDVGIFLDFFSNAAHNEKAIDSNEIFFREFQSLVFYANEMVETITNQKSSLLKLNISLEDKVQEKTKALEFKNAALEKEKEYSQDLVSAQKIFIRHAIHETNTPLAVMMANIDLFTMLHGENRHLSKIEAALKNITVIFDELSYLLKKDQVEHPKQKIEVVDYLRSRLEFFNEIAWQVHLEFDFKSNVETFMIYFNETKLQRIIDNNLSNAIKYTHHNETIHVIFEKSIKGMVISFSSHSKHIEDTEKIFEAYYRESEYQKGFGLGLNLVQSICDEEFVTISLSSDEHQTTFSYTFKGAVDENIVT